MAIATELETKRASMIAVLENNPNLAATVKELGRSFAGSGICPSTFFGEVVVFDSLMTGRSPIKIALEFLENYHLCSGKMAGVLMMRADAMASRFYDLGGEIKILSRTADLAEAELSIRSKIRKFSLSWEEAQKEAYVYEFDGKKEHEVISLIEKGSPPRIKNKYRTPRSRTQMLWARLISDGIRAMDSRANKGSYAPEELDQEEATEVEFAVEANGRTAPARPIDLEAAYATDEAASGSPPSTVAAPAAPLPPPPPPPEKKAATKPPEKPKSEAVEVYVSAEKITEIRGLFDELRIGRDAQVDVLRKRGVASLRSLTDIQAEELIHNLKKKRMQLHAAEQTEKIRGRAPEEMSASNQGPSTEEQETEVKRLLAEIKQTDPSVINRLKTKLAEHGLVKIRDMTFSDCAKLIGALSVKNIELFFCRPLESGESEVPPKN